MKRLISTLLIFFLLGVTGLPYLSWSGNSQFVYATEEEEQLSTDEIIYAGIVAYLNSRGGFIVDSVNGGISTVQSLMNTWVNSVEYWSNDPVIEKATLAANIIIRYSPFRVSLKGPAVRAFNDLYNWLVDTGKLGNLEESEGGETTDNLYNGYKYGAGLCYVIDTDYAVNHNQRWSSTGSQIIGYFKTGEYTQGSVVDSFTSSYAYNVFTQDSYNANINWNNTGNQSYTSIPVTINYSSNYTFSGSMFLRYGESGLSEYQPCISLLQDTYCVLYSTRNYDTYGNACYFVDRKYPSMFYSGIASHDTERDRTWCTKLHEYTRSTEPSFGSSNINLETDNFDKTDPTPPEGDNELDYTPEDKTTGDTFNTYNEYITNYVNKNTVVNNSSGGGGSDPDPEQPSGGTTPPWTDNGSGTLTPNGNGGFDLSLPDLTLPDLDIDWSINGLKDKFPFSIPWDLMAFFTVLNSEPETPHFEGTIPIGIWEWEIDWDLHYFDNLAILVRNLEFIAFCIGLIIVTRNIIKG